VRDLTVRGRCFLAAGAAAVICGVQIGESDFVRIGLVAAIVPVLAWLVMRHTSREIWVRRDLSAFQLEAGDTAEVQIQVGNAGDRTPQLFLEEELPEALGPSARFVLPPLAPGEQARLRYLIRAEHRGRYPVGPLHVRAGDPLGMVEMRQALPSTASILVTPRTEPLPRVALSGRWAGAGDDRTRDLVGTGSPDVTIREYRLGDDLRRIHWPTSARVDELMVRREEQQWQPRCTVLVDNRRIAHRGYGAHSSMETAVSAAASIVRHLVAQDFEVRLVSATGEASDHGWHHGGRGADLPEHLERLALMGMSRTEQLNTGWVEESQHGAMLMAVLGHLDDRDRDFLAGLATAGAASYALVLDVQEWDRSPREDPPATGALRSRGWKAGTLGRTSSLPTVWQEIAR
jgi:uncharacterized protein (DUF58 family)